MLRNIAVLCLVLGTLLFTPTLASAQTTEQVQCAPGAPCLVGVPLVGQPWKEVVLPSGTDLYLYPALTPPPAAVAQTIVPEKKRPYWVAIPVGLVTAGAVLAATYLGDYCPQTQAMLTGIAGVGSAAGTLVVVATF